MNGTHQLLLYYPLATDPLSSPLCLLHRFDPAFHLPLLRHYVRIGIKLTAEDETVAHCVFVRTLLEENIVTLHHFPSR